MPHRHKFFKIVRKKWKFEERDRDMPVMQHKFEYELNGKQKEICSSMVTEGKDHVHTQCLQP